MVMPGGDVDTWRPYSKRYEVCFAGRTGYAKLALKAGVPSHPMANAGAHETLIVLTDGAPESRGRCGLHEFARSDIFPVHLSLPWGIAVGPWPHIPLPSRLRYRIGAPVLPPDTVPAGQEPSEELVRAYDGLVQRRCRGCSMTSRWRARASNTLIERGGKPLRPGRTRKASWSG